MWGIRCVWEHEKGINSFIFTNVLWLSGLAAGRRKAFSNCYFFLFLWSVTLQSMIYWLKMDGRGCVGSMRCRSHFDVIECLPSEIGSTGWYTVCVVHSGRENPPSSSPLPLHSSSPQSSSSSSSTVSCTAETIVFIGKYQPISSCLMIPWQPIVDVS